MSEPSYVYSQMCESSYVFRQPCMEQAPIQNYARLASKEGKGQKDSLGQSLRNFDGRGARERLKKEWNEAYFVTVVIFGVFIFVWRS